MQLCVFQRSNKLATPVNKAATIKRNDCLLNCLGQGDSHLHRITCKLSSLGRGYHSDFQHYVFVYVGRILLRILEPWPKALKLA